MSSLAPSGAMTPAEHIAEQILGLADWRGDLIAQLRGLILEAAPEITEEWKWSTASGRTKGASAVPPPSKVT